MASAAVAEPSWPVHDSSMIHCFESLDTRAHLSFLLAFSVPKMVEDLEFWTFLYISFRQVVSSATAASTHGYNVPAPKEFDILKNSSFYLSSLDFKVWFPLYVHLGVWKLLRPGELWWLCLLIHDSLGSYTDRLLLYLIDYIWYYGPIWDIFSFS